MFGIKFGFVACYNKHYPNLIIWFWLDHRLDIAEDYLVRETYRN